MSKPLLLTVDLTTGEKNIMANEVYLENDIVINRNGTWRFSPPPEYSPSTSVTHMLHARIEFLENQVKLYRDILEE